MFKSHRFTRGKYSDIEILRKQSRVTRFFWKYLTQTRKSKILSAINWRVSVTVRTLIGFIKVINTGKI